MAKQVVVTIGRQFGSGGHEIGNLLAERLDIPHPFKRCNVHSR